MRNKVLLFAILILSSCSSPLVDTLPLVCINTSLQFIDKNGNAIELSDEGELNYDFSSYPSGRIHPDYSTENKSILLKTTFPYKDEERFEDLVFSIKSPLLFHDEDMHPITIRWKVTPYTYTLISAESQGSILSIEERGDIFVTKVIKYVINN